MNDTLHSGPTKTLLIVYHSMTGGTRQMVEASARGAASEPTARVRLLPAPSAQAADLLEADGYIFGTPENLAAMAGLMKDFVDRTYYPALDRISGRPYATLICAGSDGHNAARQVARIATGWRLKAIADPLIVCTHAQTPEAILAPKVIGPDDLKRCEELGAALAAGMSIGVF
jgi:NAD(P)H-dependent FMN reductase